MSFSIYLSFSKTKLNHTFLGELQVLNSSMTIVNKPSDLSILFYLIPTILFIVMINAVTIVLFRSLESNFVYRMIIYDSINNILFAIIGSYGNTYKQPIPFAMFCGLHVAFSYGLGTLNRLVPLVIVLYR